MLGRNERNKQILIKIYFIVLNPLSALFTQYFLYFTYFHIFKNKFYLQGQQFIVNI
ncbi:hypothetical protein pb186bvf_002724 [Paramecium bursaria]